jgi:hypothetical protein
MRSADVPSNLLDAAFVTPNIRYSQQQSGSALIHPNVCWIEEFSLCRRKGFWTFPRLLVCVQGGVQKHHPSVRLQQSAKLTSILELEIRAEVLSLHLE